MAENSRIDDLRRRVQHDPTSIAFAQLAEALRRSGRVSEAIDTCRAGLAHHPDYASAHVTLGRALADAGDLDAARAELTTVLSTAPENLAAIRGLAEIHQRRGEPREALEQYRRALTLAPQDPELEETVTRLAADLGPLPPVSTPEPAAPPLSDRAVPAPVGADSARFVEPPPVIAAEPDPPASRDSSSDGTAAAPTPAEPSAEARQAEALGRWLDAILADRERHA